MAVTSLRMIRWKIGSKKELLVSGELFEVSTL